MESPLPTLIARSKLTGLPREIRLRTGLNKPGSEAGRATLVSDDIGLIEIFDHPGLTEAARITIILHELAHLTGAFDHGPAFRSRYVNAVLEFLSISPSERLVTTLRDHPDVRDTDDVISGAVALARARVSLFDGLFDLVLAVRASFRIFGVRAALEFWSCARKGVYDAAC